MNRGQWQGGYGAGPMRRGFGGPQMNDNRGGRPQPNFDQRGPREGARDGGPIRPDRFNRGEGGNDRKPAPKDAPERD
jgi:hypothetical protein